MANFQPKSTAQVEKIRTGQKDLRQAQFWRSRLGYFPGENDRVGGEKTNDRHTLEPSAVSGPSPPDVFGGISSLGRNAEQKWRNH